MTEVSKSVRQFVTLNEVVAYIINSGLSRAEIDAALKAGGISAKDISAAWAFVEGDDAEELAATPLSPKDHGGALRFRTKPEAEPSPPPEEFAEAVEADLGVRFDASDLAKEAAEPITIEARNAAFEKLADLRKSDPFAAAKERKRLAKELCCSVGLVDDTVDAIIKGRDGDDGNQSQATQLVAICMDKERVQLWCAEDGEAYASVCIGGHWENHKLESRTFDQWLHYAYGQQYRVKIGNEWQSKVPGDGSARDAIRQLSGNARFSGRVEVPATRVGGDRETIWIDLGGPDWQVVQVTAQGWDIVTTPRVRFLRSRTMQALPLPVRGGRIEAVRGLINVQSGEFVLVCGWWLQALCPVGPYPNGNICGPSEAGKTSLNNMMLRMVHPTSTGLRRASRKIEDILIAARNGWALGFDNMSWMTPEMSDTFCQLSTGISTGTRAHYTNDEEFAFFMKRPLLFNGIDEELLARGDLASRTIKFVVPPITKRRTEEDLDEEFLRVWPGVFGALLDGLVGALRGRSAIDVEADHGMKAVRLMDFEKFAEAGCRAMGFGKWEFVDAMR